MWRRIHAEGCDWEVSARVRTEAGVPGPGEELLEFRPLDSTRPPRRLAVPAGALDRMDEAGLLSAFRQALPIGGDHYGRPGKHMRDTRA